MVLVSSILPGESFNYNSYMMAETVMPSMSIK